MRVQRSIEIAAPPEKIWPFLVEPEKILKWCTTIEKFEYTGEQRSGVGTPFYFEEKAGGRLMKFNFVATEWVENKRLVSRMTSGNFLKGYVQGGTIEATPSGSRFTFDEDVKLPYGIIGKFIGLFARRSSEAHLKEMLAKLKSLAEA
jgi:uncharacterized protein YndB with AHSA1/START domain